MFQSRISNNKINSIHERVLRITCNDRKSTFGEFLSKDNPVSINIETCHKNF